MKRALASDAPDSNDETAPRTIAESTYRLIRDDILWGRLAPAAPLRFEEMRARYGAGISPLREALSRLTAERLVTAIGQKGFRVAPLTIEDILDTQRTRCIIEREALRASIKAGDLAWEMSLVSAFHGLSRYPAPGQAGASIEQWALHHRQFHMTLLSACGSKLQLELAELLFDQAERHRMVRARVTPNKQLERDIQAEHVAIFEAAMARDIPRAIAALEHHYESTALQVVAALSHNLQLSSDQKETG